MNKKKLVIIAGICILIYLILSIGIKFDETGFHSILKYGDEFINII